MIEEKNLTKVGKFQKTHALKGELNAILDIDAEYFAEGKPLIVNIEGAFVPFYAESIRGKGSTTSLIKIEGVDNHEVAKELVNEDIYADKETLKEFLGAEGEELLLEDDLEGFRVVDEKLGEIGKIERVDTSTANVLFIVETEDGEELFIPAADDFIVAVDEEKRMVLTTLPEELVNLNKKER
ncbi:MAG: ribosome maturation factor RimM [Muribaculaceae bacterium]|nr:ribosome maturation factor RimM [Muribaculaceae bacterium]